MSHIIIFCHLFRSRKDPCMFFVAGKCTKNPCSYSHQLKNFHCKHYVASTISKQVVCTRGDSCKFKHAVPASEKEKRTFVRLNRSWLLTPLSESGCPDGVRKTYRAYLQGEVGRQGELKSKASGSNASGGTATGVTNRESSSDILADIDPLLAAPLGKPSVGKSNVVSKSTEVHEIPTPASNSINIPACAPPLSSLPSQSSLPSKSSSQVKRDSHRDGQGANSSHAPMIDQLGGGAPAADCILEDDFEFQDD